MKVLVSDVSKTEAVVKRAFFLAYNAARVFGMGTLQARDSVTEDQVWKNVQTRGDYFGGRACGEKEYEPYGDYVFGRMMKLGAKFDPVAGEIQISDYPPRWDYQSWCNKYPTNESLFQAAAKEIGVTLEALA